MDQETLTRAIISNLIDRYIPELAEDTNRSTRKLVDMVERISDGHFQKILCQMMQEMAKNQSSPYYGMIRDIARNTDKELLKTFYLNLGYNSWTCGARNIRLMEMQSGLFIPWVLPFMRDAVPDRMPVSEVIRLIREGRSKEIYSFFLIYRSDIDEWRELKPIISESRDCVFGLLLNTESLSEEILNDLNELYNVIIVLNTESNGWREKAALLRRRNRLYAFYRTYASESDASEILSGEWIRSIQDARPVSAASLPAINCPTAIAKKVSSAMHRFRLKQLFPLMPVDLVNDCLIISDIISYRRQMLSFAPDGTILKANEYILEKTDLNAIGTSLDDILQTFS